MGVSRMDFLQQLQEEATGSGRKDAAAAQSQLDRINAALQDLAAQHAAQNEALAAQVQQLEASCSASRKDREIAHLDFKELQSEVRLPADRVLLQQRMQADDTNSAATEGLEGADAKVAALQASFASVNEDVSKLAQDLVELRSERPVAVAEAMRNTSAASTALAEGRMDELATKIHSLQAATAGEIRGLTQDLASMRLEHDRPSQN